MVEVKKSLDRIALSPATSARVESWLEAVNSRLDGMVKVTKGDLVNALLAARAANLTDAEIQAIGRECFDEVRWLNWAMERLKRAKKDGSELSMVELLTTRDAMLGQGAKKVRPR